MPQPGCDWWHLLLSGRNTWLPGDARGFRNRGHRVHSSGDYKNRPPQGEHKGLHDYYEQRSGDPVFFRPEHRKCLGKAMLESIGRAKLHCLAIAVGLSHSHLLVECEDQYKAAQQVSARLKQASSFAVSQMLRGRIWAGGGRPIRIRDRSHQQQVFYYIVEHAEKEGAWVWRFDGAADPDLS